MKKRTKRLIKYVIVKGLLLLSLLSLLLFMLSCDSLTTETLMVATPLNMLGLFYIYMYLKANTNYVYEEKRR